MHYLITTNCHCKLICRHILYDIVQSLYVLRHHIMFINCIVGPLPVIVIAFAPIKYCLLSIVLLRKRPYLKQNIITEENVTHGVINNSPQTLQFILSGRIHTQAFGTSFHHIFRQSDKHSYKYREDALQKGTTLAKVLGFRECLNIMVSSFHPFGPLVYFEGNGIWLPLVHIMGYQSKTYIRPYLIQRMIDKGEDVNGLSTCGTQGPIPIGVALQRSDYESVRTLLMNGANPFLVNNISHICTEKFLFELIYCNVDVRNNLHNICQYKETYERSITNWMQVLTTVHTITTEDRRFLLGLVSEIETRHQQSNDVNFKVLIRTVNRLLHEPQKLQSLCRSTLRRQLPRKEIFDFVRAQVLPSKISQILLLEDILSLLEKTIIPCKYLSNLSHFIEEFESLQ